MIVTHVWEAALTYTSYSPWPAWPHVSPLSLNPQSLSCQHMGLALLMLQGLLLLCELVTADTGEILNPPAG